MKTVQLRIHDDFLQEFMQMLPKDKVKIIDQDFLNNQEKLHEVLEKFHNATGDFFPYHEEMKKIDSWIKERQAQ